MNKVAQPFEWEKLCEAIRLLREEQDYRNLLILATSCFTGLRCSDWSKLTWSKFLTKIDGKVVCRDKIVLIEQKTKAHKKKRTIYLADDFRALIVECYEGAKIRNAGDPLFIPLRGPKTGSKDGISTDGANLILKKIGARVGLPAGTTTHSFRKTFGQRIYKYLGSNFDALLYVQKIFGHSTPETTARYIGLEENRIEDAYKSLKLL